MEKEKMLLMNLHNYLDWMCEMSNDGDIMDSRYTEWFRKCIEVVEEFFEETTADSVIVDEMHIDLN